MSLDDLVVRCNIKMGESVHNEAPDGTPIDPKLMRIQRTTNPRPKVPQKELVFGKVFSDHMLEIDWDYKNVRKEGGWHPPVISAYHPLSLSPAASVLHYALECFEGMKAYKDVCGRLRLFRPELNMQRLNSSLARLYMPSVDPDAFIECIKELVRQDRDWVPEGIGYSIYLRPTAISTYPFLGVGATKEIKLFCIMSPVGPYYPEGFNPIKLYADTLNVRAWPGGVGNTKVGGNYGPTIRPQMEATRLGCAQVLWLGEDHTVTEVGAMNVFFFWVNEQGEKELITAPLCRGDVLPGVTRRSILELAGKWREFKVTERAVGMKEVVKAKNEGRLLEAFGAGTAVVVCPIRAILYEEEDVVVIKEGDDVGPLTKRMWDALTDIQYGKFDHPWSVLID
ncbi:hypothetical protein NSK_005893 [Nannochloropsis salina CCMP1776]|uniref:Branched-chain-amino-acid aminotransferase n=1 Tax=Nannochloropsis salina CCMP1776 TaxID=1027361 RepID=A0A4D9D2E3_9STRA|nr:hypothetical protein NSK_005893 [Nannochloropsis salina CCMP1776]|eukprot:TFJ82818.1 hypothetical protein NSK_005893 [Nannochloropsis salina CCMP1776]